MGAVVDVLQLVSATLAEWNDIRPAELRFWHADAARLALVALGALAMTLVVLRSTLARRSDRQRVGLPALLRSLQRPSSSFMRHTPVLLMSAGLPFFALALADPYSTLTERLDTFPGRRICLMLDASSSMIRPFTAPTLRTGSASSQATFFTTVAAAERFVQLRMNGKYKDLVGLVEFGDQAYVVTPFTTDYDNILLSLNLVGDFTEFIRFPDQGTILARAVEQGVNLFRAFDFLDATGNIMVLFSDGEDSEVIAGNRGVAEIVRDAVDAKVPIYFVRTRFDRGFGRVVSDAQWKDAVERTGGRFYAASDEATLIQAIQDIDRVSAGRIEVKQYVSQRPKYRPFALIAAALWSVAVGLALTIPQFRSFP
ncbi:MAG: vWA domain-containing protein [Vicinamibacterales bacterium]